MLTIWGRKTSSNVQALMWCVGELGLAYERHDVGHKYGGNDTGAFLQMNPNGKSNENWRQRARSMFKLVGSLQSLRQRRPCPGAGMRRTTH